LISTFIKPILACREVYLGWSDKERQSHTIVTQGRICNRRWLS